MLIRDSKHFWMGFGLLVGFFAVLWYMFTPSFGGVNAFKFSDNMFNSIAKDSTNYIPQVTEEAKVFEGQSFKVTIMGGTVDVKLLARSAVILNANGLKAVNDNGSLTVSGDIGKLMAAAMADSASMYANDDSGIKSRYGIDGRAAMFTWWKMLKEIKVALDRQKVFKPASFLDKKVIKRGVEVGYNFFGIEGRSAASEWKMITFALAFYVIYTMWFGYSIFFMFEGVGLAMTAGKKKEV